MISQSKALQDAIRRSAVAKGPGIMTPSSKTSRIVDKVYSGEQNFPIMGGDWLFSLEALAWVGKSMFGEQWDRAEFDALLWPTAPVEAHRRGLQIEQFNVKRRKHMATGPASNDYSCQESLEEFEAKKEVDLQQLITSAKEPPAFVGIQQRLYDKNRAALDRLNKAAKWLGDKCRSGGIKTGYGAVENLPLISSQSHSWNCISDLQHWVKDGSIDIFMVSARKMHRCKAYVSRSDLEREMRTLAHIESNIPKTDLARLAPDLQLAVRLAIKLELFGTAIPPANGKLETAVIAAAKDEVREIAPNRVAEIVRLMRYPDKAKSDAGKKRAGK